MNFIQSAFQWFSGIPWRDIFFTLRVVFIVLDIVLIILFVFVFIKSLPFRPKFVFNPKPAKGGLLLKDAVLKGRWQQVVEKAHRSPPQSLTLGIIEADSFIDDILKRMDLKGEHMADRLERLGTRDLKTVESLWKAHKIRNNLVHTPGFVLSPTDAKMVLRSYESFLKEVGVL
ncbi:MAG: hypothetical protein KJI72_01060 [Patescibacteria group bacterium]|nr:hypothetical protein [Patescibacteria group bacterium]